MTSGNTNRGAALIIAALAATAFIAGAGVTAVAADHDTDSGNNPADDLLNQNETDDVCNSLLGRSCAMLKSAARGWVDGLTGAGDAPEADADTYAENTIATFNSGSGSLQSLANNHTTADDDWSVIRFTFTDANGNTAYMFVVSDINHTSGEFENPRAMNYTEFQETGHRSYDQWYRLDPKASRNAADELDRFITDYAEQDELPDDEYMGYMAGKYGGGVDGSTMPGDN